MLDHTLSDLQLVTQTIATFSPKVDSKAIRETGEKQLEAETKEEMEVGLMGSWTGSKR